MTWLITFILFFVEALSASTSPLTSNFGDAFRTGEVTISLGAQDTYDLSPTFSSALSSTAVGVALSLVDYNQTFDTTYKIFYNLYENTPSASNATNAVFRLYLGFYSITSSARVRFLG